MDPNIVFRKAGPDDADAIIALVMEVVSETYGTMFEGSPPVSTNRQMWTESRIAIVGGKLAGIGLAEENYIDDLWVRAQFRGQHIGARLLTMLEDQIRSSGHTEARLRVVADNSGARRFYATHGWQETRIYPHERNGHLMIDFHKPLQTGK